MYPSPIWVKGFYIYEIFYVGDGMENFLKIYRIFLFFFVKFFVRYIREGLVPLMSPAIVEREKKNKNQTFLIIPNNKKIPNMKQLKQFSNVKVNLKSENVTNDFAKKQTRNEINALLTHNMRVREISQKKYGILSY